MKKRLDCIDINWIERCFLYKEEATIDECVVLSDGLIIYIRFYPLDSDQLSIEKSRRIWNSLLWYYENRTAGGSDSRTVILFAS